MAESKDPPWVKITVALITTAGVVAAAWIGVQRSRQRGVPAGEILSPVSGDSVGESYQVTGTLADIPPDHHVWLAVEIGNQLWIKEPEVPGPGPEWTRDIVQGATADPYALTLLLVPQDGQAFISEWFEHGRRTCEYPGIDSIPGAIRLDIVSRLLPRPDE